MPIVFKSRVFSVETVREQLPNGREHEMAIVRHRPSVVLIPMEDDGRVVLIRQFRRAIDKTMWELPAGNVDEGETAEAAAARECEEEIGRRPARVERLGSFYPTPGYCDELLIFFRVSGLHQPPADSPHKPDDDEDIEATPVTVDEARAMVGRGDIIDLKTAYGIALL
jgi:ADP-ribose pyrophosphatase